MWWSLPAHPPAALNECCLCGLINQLVAVSALIVLGYGSVLYANKPKFDPDKYPNKQIYLEASAKNARENQKSWGPGLGYYIGNIALPAMFFRAVATTDFTTADQTVLLTIIVGKMVMIGLGVLVGHLTASQLYTPSEKQVVTPPMVSSQKSIVVNHLPSNWIAGGILGLMVTNGDELGLGLPAIGAIFKPELVVMLYPVAAIQKLLISSCAFLALETGDKLKGATGALSFGSMLFEVLIGELQQRLVQAMLVGLACNLASGMSGMSLPPSIDNLTGFLEHSFTAVIMFKSGVETYGTLGMLLELENAWLPILAVLLKSIVLPTLLRTVCVVLGGSSTAMNFVFMVGVLPSAGSTLSMVSMKGSATGTCYTHQKSSRIS